MSAHSSKSIRRRVKREPDPLCDKRAGYNLSQIDTALRKTLADMGQPCVPWGTKKKR